MANNADRWYFTKEQLDETPSRKAGYDTYKELSYRQQTANFIQDMGQRLKVSQLCINTAIVYMHRFYVFHSFTNFPWHQMAAAALFLAAKVEEQPRKLEYVIRVANVCRNNPPIEVGTDRYAAQSQDLVFNENVLLQTLGFDVAIDHPHTHVVRCCHLVRASKDLAQSSYFLASNSLHLTTMCLQYKPTVVACFCIHLACKWSSWEIPLSSERKEWFLYVDPTVTSELLQQLTEEFLSIFESCPSRLKEKIMAIGDNGMHNTTNTIVNSPFDIDPKKVPSSSDSKDPHSHRSQHDGKTGSEADPHKHRSSRPHDSSQMQKEREYREKKLAQQQHLKQSAPGQSAKGVPHGHHHRPSVDPKLKTHSRQPSVSGQHTTSRAEPRDILREAARDSPFGIATKDFQVPRNEQSRSEKDAQKREYLLKPITTETNNFSESRSSYNGENNKQRVDPNRVPSRTVEPNKVPIKHETVRRHNEMHPFDNKKHVSHDRNSYMKSVNSTSQKVKSPFAVDTSKSVPKSSQLSGPIKHHHNGNSNGGSSYNLPMLDATKEEIPVPQIIKRPSLFSPEKSPERKRNSSHKILPPVGKPAESVASSSISPLLSPNNNKRARNYSTGSEPELRPVMTKIDQVEGFENLMRDSSIGINKLHLVPDIITPIADKEKTDEPVLTYSKEMRPPDIIPPLGADVISMGQPIVNGIETNPMLISSLLKETPPIPHLPVVASVPPKLEVQSETKEHHHHKSKKKNKEKHKHKDKSKEDKDKKKKHKDKDREKHKHKHDPTEPAEPIKIKIQKDKIQSQLPPPAPRPAMPLKIKISKDVIKTDLAELNQSATVPPIGIKLIIPKDKISNCTTSELIGSSRKRERDRSSPGQAPPAKIAKTSSHRDSKQNGRHSYAKVSNNYNNSAPPPVRFYNNPASMSMYPPPQQQHPVYFYPTASNVAPTGQTFVYPDGQMYAQYYNTGYMYPPEMYQQPPPPPPGSGSNPPLPMDAPPDIPPPPPPE